MAIGFVGGAFSTGSTTAGTSKTITYSPAANNTLVVFGFGVGASVTNVTDTAGNKYYARVTPITNTVEATCWSTNAGKSVAGTSITVTVTFSSSVQNTCVIVEYSGVTGIGKAATNTGSSAGPTISLTTQNANNVVVAGFSTEGTATWSLTTGTALRENQAGAGATTPGGGVIDNTSASAASVTCTATISVSGAWAANALELTTVQASEDNDDDNFWGGRWLGTTIRGVAVAALAASTFSAGLCSQVIQDRDDLPAHTLHGQPDEDIPWTAPLIWPPPPTVLLGFSQQSLASVLVADEDLWQNPTPPVQLAFACPNPWQWEQNEQTATAVFQPDEDLWVPQTPPQPFPPPPLVFTDDDVIVPQPTAFQPDEDYWQNYSPPPQTAPPAQQWQFDADYAPAISIEEELWKNPVPPVQSVLLPPQPWQWEQNESPVLSGQPDEDYWQNWVVPSQLSLAWPQPWTFDQDESPTLEGQLDEDLWQNRVNPVQLSFSWPSPWQFEQNEPSTLSGLPEEDLWQNQVAPVQATLGKLYLPDPEEIQAGNLSGVPDEVYWFAPPPTVATNIPISSWVDSDFAQAPTGFTPEEDLWTNPVQPVQSVFQFPSQSQFEQNESPILNGQPDEDLWRNSVAPVTATLAYPQPFSFDQPDLPILATDEDLWRNAVPPVQAALLSPAPWSFEQNESPTLSGQPDEDLWVNSVPPVQLTLQWPTPWGFEQNESPTLSGQPDEDYWQNRVSPVQLALQWPNPWQFDQDESPTLEGQLDEDLWSPQIPPQSWSVPLQAFRDDDGFVPQVVFHPDEDYWAYPVIQPAPVTVVFGFPQEGVASTLAADEDFWQNPVPSVQFTLGRLYLPDPEEIPAHTLRTELDEDFWVNPIVKTGAFIQNFVFGLVPDDPIRPTPPLTTTSFVVWLDDD